MAEEQASESTCVNCAGNDLVMDYASGDYICKSCGVVQPEQVIDMGKEWRDFDNEDQDPTQNARVERVDDEFPTLGTQISINNFGSTAVSATAKTLTRFSKLAGVENKSDQQLKYVYARINELGEKLQLSGVIRTAAKEIIKQFVKRRDKNSKGFRKESFIIAALLVASKVEQGGRTLKDFTRALQVDEREIKKFYKLLKDSSLTNLGYEPRKSIWSEVQELVDVFCSRLKQPYGVANEAKGVAEKAIDFLEGKRPSSIAAASLLFIFNLLGLQNKVNELANVASISPHTLRNVYKDICQNLDRLPVHLFDNSPA